MRMKRLVIVALILAALLVPTSAGAKSIGTSVRAVEGVTCNLPESDAEIGGTRPVEFERDVRDLEELVERFTADGCEHETWRHPMFGHMSYDDWQRWGYLHMDHHLRQFGV